MLCYYYYIIKGCNNPAKADTVENLGVINKWDYQLITLCHLQKVFPKCKMISNIIWVCSAFIISIYQHSNISIKNYYQYQEHGLSTGTSTASHLDSNFNLILLPINTTESENRCKKLHIKVFWSSLGLKRTNHYAKQFSLTRSTIHETHTVGLPASNYQDVRFLEHRGLKFIV